MSPNLQTLLRSAIAAYKGELLSYSDMEDGDIYIKVKIPSQNQQAFNKAIQSILLEPNDKPWASTEQTKTFQIKVGVKFAALFDKFYQQAPSRKIPVGVAGQETTKDRIKAAIAEKNNYDDKLAALAAAQLHEGELSLHPVLDPDNSVYAYHILYKETDGPTWFITEKNEVLNLSSLDDVMTATKEEWRAIDIKVFRQFDAELLKAKIQAMRLEKFINFVTIYLSTQTYNEDQKSLLNMIVANRQGEHKLTICKYAIENNINSEFYYPHLLKNLEVHKNRIDLTFRSAGERIKFIKWCAQGKELEGESKLSEADKALIDLHRMYLQAVKEPSKEIFDAFNKKVQAQHAHIPIEILETYLKYELDLLNGKTTPAPAIHESILVLFSQLLQARPNDQKSFWNLIKNLNNDHPLLALLSKLYFESSAASVDVDMLSVIVNRMPENAALINQAFRKLNMNAFTNALKVDELLELADANPIVKANISKFMQDNAQLPLTQLLIAGMAPHATALRTYRTLLFNDTPEEIVKFYKLIATMEYKDIKDELARYFTQGNKWILDKKVAIVPELVVIFNLGMLHGDERQQGTLKAAVSKLSTNSPLYKALPPEYQTNLTANVQQQAPQQPQQQQQKQPQQQEQSSSIPTWLKLGGALAFTAALIKYPKQTIAVGAISTVLWLGYQQNKTSTVASNRVTQTPQHRQ